MEKVELELEGTEAPAVQDLLFGEVELDDFVDLAKNAVNVCKTPGRW